jgi:hypothetical protein
VSPTHKNIPGLAWGTSNTVNGETTVDVAAQEQSPTNVNNGGISQTPAIVQDKVGQNTPSGSSPSTTPGQVVTQSQQSTFLPSDLAITTITLTSGSNIANSSAASASISGTFVSQTTTGTAQSATPTSSSTSTTTTTTTTTPPVSTIRSLLLGYVKRSHICVQACTDPCTTYKNATEVI